MQYFYCWQLKEKNYHSPPLREPHHKIYSGFTQSSLKVYKNPHHISILHNKKVESHNYLLCGGELIAIAKNFPGFLTEEY